MANLGRFFLFAFVLLLALKTLAISYWTFSDAGTQVVAVEEESENEDADPSFEFEFSDEFMNESELFYVLDSNLCLAQNAQFKACSQALYLVHIPTSLRPPCKS